MKTELILGLLLILGLRVKARSPVQPFNDGKKLQLPGSYNIAWMKNLKNNLLISKITLPATHDTLALYGGPAVECQAWTLENQLKAGIRYLDFRAYVFANTLYLMQGVISERSTFTETLHTIKKFLSDYPSEIVLVRVKPELFDKSKVQELAEKITANDANVWVQSKMPTIGMVRGKVVFVQKDSFQLGISLVATDTKGDYKVDDIKHKENDIAKNLNQALTQCGGQAAVLTYSSGTGIGTFKGMFLTPKKVAEKIDPWLYNYLQVYRANVPGVCLGIIAMDFPGFDLIQTVIDIILCHESLLGML